MGSDSELVTRIRAGDRAAPAELCARYLPVVWRYAWAQLRPHEHAARDAVSETFLAAIRGMRALDVEKGSVAQWLMGIARHKIADARGRRQAAREGLDQAVTAGGDPGEPLARQEMQAAVQGIMLSLEDEYRLALEWKYLEDVSVREIAARLDSTEKAAEALLFRARAEFRKRSRTLLDVKEC